ncbi:hypothetical protein D3C80_2029770 [compost metagenome]
MQLIRGHTLSGQQCQQQAGGQTNQRRTTHAQGADVIHQFADVAAFTPVSALRQGLLVEDPQLIFTNT